MLILFKHRRKMPRKQEIEWFTPEEFKPNPGRLVLVKTGLEGVETKEVGYVKSSGNRLLVDVYGLSEYLDLNKKDVIEWAYI